MSRSRTPLGHITLYLLVLWNLYTLEPVPVVNGSSDLVSLLVFLFFVCLFDGQF